MIGVIEVLNKDKGDFSEDDLVLLEVICSKLSHILYYGDDYKQLKEASEEGEKLKKVIKDLTSELHFFPLIKKIIQRFHLRK